MVGKIPNPFFTKTQGIWKMCNNPWLCWTCFPWYHSKVNSWKIRVIYLYFTEFAVNMDCGKLYKNSKLDTKCIWIEREVTVKRSLKYCRDWALLKRSVFFCTETRRSSYLECLRPFVKLLHLTSCSGLIRVNFLGVVWVASSCLVQHNPI